MVPGTIRWMQALTVENPNQKSVHLVDEDKDEDMINLVSDSVPAVLVAVLGYLAIITTIEF